MIIKKTTLEIMQCDAQQIPETVSHAPIIMTLMTEAMTISKYKSTKPPNLNLQGLTFKYSYEIKDLGVALDKNLN